MRIAYIEMSGFRGARDVVRIKVPSSFLVIAGRNGSGKSTICDALEYVLTGKIREHTHKEKGESYEDYVWWRGESSSVERYVEIGFVDSTGALHSARRTPNGIDSASLRVLAMLVHSERAPANPFQALVRSSIIRDEEITKLSVDLPESERYKFVRDSLGNISFEDTEKRLETLRKHLEEMLQIEKLEYDRGREKIADATSRLSELQSSVASQVSYAAVEAKLRELLRRPTENTTEILTEARDDLTTRRSTIDQLHHVLAEIQELEQVGGLVLSTEHASKEAELVKAVEEATNKDREVAEMLSQVVVQLEMLRDDQSKNTLCAELLERGEQLGLNDGFCPLCGCSVQETEFYGHIDKMRSTIQGSSEGIVDVVQKHHNLQLEKSRTANNLEVAEVNLQNHRSTRLQFDRKLQAAMKLVDRSNDSATDIVGIASSIRNKIDQERLHCRILEDGITLLESSTISEMILTTESQLAEVKKLADEAFAKLSRIEKSVERTKTALRSLKTLIGEVIEEQLAELSPLIEEIYMRLRPHVEWTTLKYRLRGDVRRMLSFEIGDGLNPSFIFSSGQRRTAGIAFLLAVYLSRPWCLLDTLLLDDPVQHVDDFRALNLTEVLAAIRKSGRQIIVCVEDEALGRLMCRRLRGGKDYGSIIRMQYDYERGIEMIDEEVVKPSSSFILVSA